MKLDLAVTGVGMVSPVGRNPAECLHSVRSGITRLSVQRLPDRTRQWISGGNCMVWSRHAGARHLQYLAGLALHQAWQHAGRLAPMASHTRTALILGAPDTERPGYLFPSPGADLVAWAALHGLAGVVHVEVMPAGACSTQMALHRAAELLDAGHVEACVVGAADSQLQLRVVRWHEEHRRLKCSTLTDGLMPGEAAAFLVVESARGAHARGAAVFAQLLSSAVTREEANIFGEAPNTAVGLTKAVRAALGDAGVAAKDIGMAWSDLNGESYRAREWAYAELRNGVTTATELLHSADCHADLGAASDANLLALAAMSHATGWAAGKPLLIFSGSEGGLRAATVMVAPPTMPPLPQVSGDQPALASLSYAIGAAPNTVADLRDSNDAPATYFAWQLRDEHRDAIAALHYQRRAILQSTEGLWTRLLVPERRLLRHLDAVMASGSKAIAAIADGVNSDEEGHCFAAALLIGVLPSATNFERLHTSLDDHVPRLRGIGDALQHVPRSDALAGFVARCLHHEVAAVRAMALQLAARQRIALDLPSLMKSLTSPHVDVLCAAAEASCKLRVVEAVPNLAALIDDARPEVRRAAARALAGVGPEALRSAVRLSAGNGKLADPTLAVALAMTGQAEDAARWITALDRAPDDADLIAALAIIGTPATVEALMACHAAATDEARPALNDALRRICLPLSDHPDRRIDRSLPDEPVLDDASSASSASSAFWASWWQRNASRFERSVRHRHGQRWSPRACAFEIAHASTPFCVRQDACTELSAVTGMAVALEPDWFVARQRSTISTLFVTLDAQAGHLPAVTFGH